MNANDETHRHLQRMREQAVELEADSERSKDPEERRRLQERVKQLELDCEQESMMAAGDIYPCE